MIIWNDISQAKRIEKLLGARRISALRSLLDAR